MNTFANSQQPSDKNPQHLWAIPLALGVFAAIVGGLIGWFLISLIVAGLAENLKLDWLKANARWISMVAVGLLNGWASFRKHRKSLLRQHRQKDVGKEFGLSHATDLDDRLSDAIEELLGGSAMLSGGVLHRDFGDTHLVVADVLVTRSSHSSQAGNSERTFTVALMEDPSLNLPDFRLQPQQFLLTWVMRMVGFKEVKFENHAAFSNKYLINGISISNLKSFFNVPLLDYFAELNGWQVHASGVRVLVWQPQAPLASNDIEKFIDQSFEIFAQLRQRHSTWQSEKKTSSNHLSGEQGKEMDAANSTLDGLVGGMISSYLVRPSDIKKMLTEPVPRRWLPSGIKREKLGFPIVPLIGLMFLVGGIVFAVISLSPNAEIKNAPPWLFPLLGFSLILGGIPLLIGGCWYRYHWSRLLRRGSVASAEVLDVERTGVKINNLRRYLVTVRYLTDLRSIETQVAVYGRGGELALQAKAENRPLHVLYDSERPKRVFLAEGFINYQ